jgi:hypothetical protein
MAKIKIILNKRKSHKTTFNQYPLILNIGHKSRARELSLNLLLREDQFDEAFLKITGINNSVRHTKRINKIYAAIDFWLESNQAEIKLWSIDKLKETIERRFFNKQIDITLLMHGGKYL